MTITNDQRSAELEMTTKELFEKMARATNSGFAIAFALLELAQAQRNTAAALDRLGVNLGGSAPGTTEKIAMELTRLVDVIADKAEAQ
ncbi:hypothetical protein AS156_25760 [Bradyrhizobium macuxiense]|uniref:Uncharacterized protein n=1 Tax=Bradyrhizobium macuxiense TaxID=1755647 RepID=A0A109K5P6_9BRAD|nr:hypothetical protein [Bradyrhizobium macuxiense]KWV61126.1 hypothetical protein AS156_25760 [Bradyrhizobium macuxiense]